MLKGLFIKPHTTMGTTMGQVFLSASYPNYGSLYYMCSKSPLDKRTLTKTGILWFCNAFVQLNLNIVF